MGINDIGNTTVHHPGQAGGGRGKRSGVRATGIPYYGIERQDYVLGNDPNYAANQANQANQRAGISRAEQNIVRSQSERDAQYARNSSQAAQGRANPAAQQVERSGQTGLGQGELASRLRAFAEGPEGPSAAQAQLRQGTDQAMQQQLALARSGGGVGQNAANLGRAQANASALAANQANEAARLRADETARHRDRQLSAFSASGDVLADQRSGYAQEGGMELDAQAQRDAAALGYAQEGRANLGLASDASSRAFRDEYDAQALGLEAERAALQGRMGYQAAEADMYQAELQDAQEHRRQDRDRDKDWAGGISGVVSSFAGLAGLSDVRAKRGITRLSDGGEYGDPAAEYFALSDPKFSLEERRKERAERYEDRRAEEEQGGAMLQKGLSMISDRNSKQRIRELEEINAQYEALFDRPPATEGVPRRGVPEMREPDFRDVGTYEYEYKDPERHGRGRYVGPMAQELEHIPGVVKETRDGKAVDQGRLTMVNTSKLGEHERELDELEREFRALYGRPAATSGMR